MNRSSAFRGTEERSQRRAHHRARPVAPLPESQLAPLYVGADLVDAYAVDLPPDTVADAGELARFVMAHPPPWVFPLISARDAVMGAVGAKTAGTMKREGGKAGSIGSFPVLSRSAEEIVMGTDDSHLDFRTAMLIRSRAQGERDLCWVTVVRCHNLFGRIYIRVIAPFHRAIIKGYLDRAANAGWPAASVSADLIKDNVAAEA